MSLREYFDTALKPDAKAASRGRATPPNVTVKTGEEAKRHLQQAQDSLAKMRAKQEKRKQQA